MSHGRSEHVSADILVDIRRCSCRPQLVHMHQQQRLGYPPSSRMCLNCNGGQWAQQKELLSVQQSAH